MPNLYDTIGIIKNGNKTKLPVIIVKNIDADGVAYDNTSSGLSASDVQGAIDEVNGKIQSPTIETTPIEITSFPYTFPSNGYLRATSQSGSFSERYIQLETYGYVSLVMSGNDLRYYSKGMKVVTAYGVNLYFYPIN